MKIGTACAIFLQINSEKYTDEEKGTAILEVLKMPTHNGISKSAMLEVIGYLLNLAFDVPEESEVAAVVRVFSDEKEVAHDEQGASIL